MGDVTLVSLGENAPSGENLEYEQVFTDLMLAAQPGEERQVGNEIVPAAEPDARAIVTAAEAVLAKSHDLRAAVLWGYAGARLNGFAGFARAAAYIRGCLEEFWESCHPQLDAEDDDDPTMRVNAVLGLCDTGQTLRALRNAPLTESGNFGRFTLNDLAIVDGERSPPAGMDSVPDATRVAAAFRDTPIERLEETRAAAEAALADIRAVDAVFDERLPGRGPDLSPLVTLLRKVATRLAAESGGAAEAPEAEAAEGAATSETAGAAASAAAAPAGPAAPGAIGSPGDVERAIDAIIAYYRKTEPSSPVPIILDRAKRLVGADFMTIVNDIAPGGVENVRLVGGLPEPEGSSEW